MTSPAASPLRLTTVQWLVVTIASIGFAFDTYELLMTPLIAGPALAEILGVPANNPLVTQWVGNLLWMTALCGGVFGLLGGWLTDRLGRRNVMAGSIMLYSMSPVLASLSTSLTWFLFFRCATFVGVCVEFVAAITWLAELFPDKRQKELVLGWTQAFASVGGLLVTSANMLAVKYANMLPGLPVAEPFDAHAYWRYTLTTGLLPAIPIALMLPFVPESPVWQEKRKAGTLRRPSLLELFSPQLRRITLVTAGLSACAYGAAFGALQLTPTQVVPGLPDLAEQRTELKPLQEKAKTLNEEYDEKNVAFMAATADVPGLNELAGQRRKLFIDMRTKRNAMNEPKTSEEAKSRLKDELADLTKQAGLLTGQLNELTASHPDAKQAVLKREAALRQLGDNRDEQKPFDDTIKTRGNQVQLFQELGGLAGRIVLALLLLAALSRRTLLRIFQLPGLLVVPLTYIYLFRHEPAMFQWGVAAAGFLTVAQFSYFGELLPKVFPLHLRGTGGSFATNVGGRMLGTSAAFVTTNLIAPLVRFANTVKDPDTGAAIATTTTFEEVATAAAVVGTAVFVIGLALSFLLPESSAEPAAEGTATGAGGAQPQLASQPE